MCLAFWSWFARMVAVKNVEGLVVMDQSMTSMPPEARRARIAIGRRIGSAVLANHRMETHRWTKFVACSGIRSTYWISYVVRFEC